MNLSQYLKKTAQSTDPRLQEQAVALQALIGSNPDFADRQVEENEDEKGLDPALQQISNGVDGKKPKDELDQLLQSSMPEITQPDEAMQKSTFGKVSCWQKLASAFIKDTKVHRLPSRIRKEVQEQVGQVGKTVKVVQYGMTVQELLPKIDAHNFALAEAHVRKSFEKKPRQVLLRKFFEKARNKSILLLNDKIIDGHHFLAEAKQLKITRALRVLDLTPLRFQEKQAQDHPFMPALLSTNRTLDEAKAFKSTLPDLTRNLSRANFPNQEGIDEIAKEMLGKGTAMITPNAVVINKIISNLRGLTNEPASSFTNVSPASVALLAKAVKSNQDALKSVLDPAWRKYTNSLAGGTNLTIAGVQ